jgi:hypothetical protein
MVPGGSAQTSSVNLCLQLKSIGSHAQDDPFGFHVDHSPVEKPAYTEGILNSNSRPDYIYDIDNSFK